jgi:nicotinate phosphoribosyltransferase
MKSSLPYKAHDLFAVARDEAEITTFLNNDVYKFLMLDFILAHPEYRDLTVRWKMKIRSKDVRTLDVIPEEALREQLDAVKNIRWVSQADLSFLWGMKRPDGQPLFRQETLTFLNSFRLPNYNLTRGWDGNYEMEFEGPWITSMMWEIPALKIINTLQLYYYIKKWKLSPSELNEVFTKVFWRLYEDIKVLKSDSDISISEFGTRRSASTDIQRIVLENLEDRLKWQCTGTSNVMLAREFWNLNPKWTNAHELRMIPTALYDTSEDIIKAMYDVDKKWGQHFPWLSILLPDTYGTTFYFENCPQEIIEAHNGCRFDSKNPLISIPEYVQFLTKHGKDPLKYIGIPSDGLDSKTVLEITKACKHEIWKITFGVGTNLTNNTKGTWPRDDEPYGPFGSFSVVVKPSEVRRPDGTWVSCVKLSDNPTKATGAKTRVEKFKWIFGVKWMESHTVAV